MFVNPEHVPYMLQCCTYIANFAAKLDKSTVVSDRKFISLYIYTHLVVTQN